ncbi:hypothetical protein F4803DRAFT_511204 [Xylaria telfairii]|nr:hypothetical protein F4803DRAFT_511204 [Xylaria telfairii]
MGVGPFTKSSGGMMVIEPENRAADENPSRRDQDSDVDGDIEEIERGGDSDDGKEGDTKGRDDADGIDSKIEFEDVPHAISSQVVKGKSFLADGYRLGSWSFASDLHGTQMANLICAIDPHCGILVPKVTEGRYGVDAGRLFYGPRRSSGLSRRGLILS